MVDASLGEIMTTCEKINWLLSEGEKCLKPEYRYCLNLFCVLLIILSSYFRLKTLVVLCMSLFIQKKTIPPPTNPSN